MVKNHGTDVTDFLLKSIQIKDIYDFNSPDEIGIKLYFSQLTKRNSVAEVSCRHYAN